MVVALHGVVVGGTALASESLRGLDLGGQGWQVLLVVQVVVAGLGGVAAEGLQAAGPVVTAARVRQPGGR